MLKIRLVLADIDEGYISRLTNYFNGNYSDKLEVFLFTQTESLINFIQSNKIDVLLVNESFELNPKLKNGNFAFAYLVDSPGIETLHDRRAICKFQKAELIYKEVLNLYSEKSENNGVGLKLSDESDTSIITVLPCSGGVGGSTLAAACCMNLAARAKRVLYLNLEQFGTPNMFFNAEGSFDLWDVFYAVKSKKNNLALKLESTVKKDESGVCFYDNCKIPLDNFEMSADDIKTLIMEIVKSTLYDYIVIDTDLIFNEKLINIMTYSNRLMVVTDGSQASAIKFTRLYETLGIVEEQKNIAVTSRLVVVYNRFRNDVCKQIPAAVNLNVLGVIGEYTRLPAKNIAIQISKTEVFNKL